MREDYLEQLDKMFPQGYVICYTNPNGDFRMSLFNPYRYEFIGKVYDILKDFSEETNEE